MKIEDNFLDEQSFQNLQNLIFDPYFAWYYNKAIDYEDDEDKFQFTHTFYNNDVPTSSEIKKLNPLIEKIKPLLIYRIKANLLTKTPNIIENKFHIDISYFVNFPEKLKLWTTSIFYVNTNNGYTEFEDGTKVESIENRLVSFPTDMKHRGTSCTDQNTRIVINFNYIK